MEFGKRRRFCCIAAGVIALAPVLQSGNANAAAPAARKLTRPASVKAPPPPEHKLACPARFITCMTWDQFRHAAWIGTEGHGIYEYRPWASRKKRWLHYSKSSGLADNSCYAIAVDTRARVWAGTDRHGVDVFISRSKGWQRYDVLPLAHKGNFGPLGSHPFCISLDPFTHAIWMGTEAGISIYSTRTHRWRYLTVANGLPSDQINAIAFLPKGQVLIGTACQGLVIGTPRRILWPAKDTRGTGRRFAAELIGKATPYRWNIIRGPWHTPTQAMGSGLPSSLINALLVHTVIRPTGAGLAAEPNVDVATDSGLAISSAGTKDWRFEQGRDYAARVLGLFHPPAGFRSPPQAELANLLSGEHITCLARGAAGNLWLGFWRDGYMVISPHGSHIYRTIGDPRFANTDSYVQAILPLPNGKVLIGRYGHGVSVIKPQKLAGWLKPGKHVKLFTIIRPSIMDMPVMVKYPKPAAIPTVQQMIALRNALLKIKPDDATTPEIIPLNDDWKTRGNELDNYGRLHGFLGAMNHIIDQSTTEAYWFSSSFEGFINPHWNSHDGIRRWISSKSTSDPRALENPSSGSRTMSSWDDHGEAYSPNTDGPNLYFALALPAGKYILSLYFVNDDGQSGTNRYRDYQIEIRPIKPLSLNTYRNLPFKADPGIQAFGAAPVFPGSRVSAFYDGVYKRFFVSVPAAKGGFVTIRVHRNHSFNTIMSGIFLDRLFALPKQRVVPPLILEHRPFRSWQQWRRDPLPPQEVAEVAKIFYRGDLLQIKLNHGMTRRIIRQAAVSAARQEILSRDLLGPHVPLPRAPIPPKLLQEFRHSAPNNRWRIVREITQVQKDYARELTATPAGRRAWFQRREIHLSRGNCAAQAIMRQLLYLRRANAAWMAANCRPVAAALTHFLLADGADGVRAATLSTKTFSPPVFSRYYLASLLWDAGLPHDANRIYFRTNNYALFAYNWNAKHGKTKPPKDAVAYQQIFKQWTQKQQEKEMLKWPESQNNG